MAQRSDIEIQLADWLEVACFRDYGPNGVQVEGKPEVRKISEPHCSAETGVAFIACGHHASERFGAAALGEQVPQ